MSKPVVPTSVVTTVSRLLRSFHDDNALSRNPLVSRRFGSDLELRVVAERIRSEIRAAIDSIVATARPSAAEVARRQRHVLLRYDIEGATREEVCAELGITQRQLYRDRIAAAEVVARAIHGIQAQADSAAQTQFMVDPSEAMLQSALRMKAAGTTIVASERLAGIAREASQERWRIVALCASAQFNFGVEQFARAQEANDAARRIFEEHREGFDSTHAVLMSALLDAGTARTVWERGAHRQAIDLLRSVGEAFLMARRKIGATDPLVHVLLLALTRSAFVFCEAGDIKSAEVLLADVRSSIESFPALPSYLDMERRGVLAHLHRLCSPHYEMLERDVEENLMLAQRRGLPAAASDNAMLLAWIATRRGDVQKSQQMRNAAVRFVDGVDSIWLRSMIRAVAALMEGKIGEPQRALELALEAKRGFSKGSEGLAYSEYVLSNALLACGRAEEACAVARETVAAPLTNTFLRASALVVMAKSAYALGKIKEAIENADAAIDLLRAHYSGTYILDDAIALRAKVASS